MQAASVASFEIGPSKMLMPAVGASASCGKVRKSLAFERTSMLMVRSGISDDERSVRRTAEPVLPLAPRIAWTGILLVFVLSGHKATAKDGRTLSSVANASYLNVLEQGAGTSQAKTTTPAQHSQCLIIVCQPLPRRARGDCLPLMLLASSKVAERRAHLETARRPTSPTSRSSPIGSCSLFSATSPVVELRTSYIRVSSIPLPIIITLFTLCPVSLVFSDLMAQAPAGSHALRRNHVRDAQAKRIDSTLPTWRHRSSASIA